MKGRRTLVQSVGIVVIEVAGEGVPVAAAEAGVAAVAVTAAVAVEAAVTAGTVAAEGAGTKRLSDGLDLGHRLAVAINSGRSFFFVWRGTVP